MKLQKLLPAIVVFWLATGAGSAFAEDITNCDRFYIHGEPGQPLEVDSITLTGQSCILSYVNVYGDVTVTNAGRFEFQNSNVGGTIRVIGSGDVGLQQTDADGSLILKGNELVSVYTAIVGTAIRVIRNKVATVVGNAAPVIRCRDNIRLVGTENESSSGNNCETLNRFAPAD